MIKAKLELSGSLPKDVDRILERFSLFKFRYKKQDSKMLVDVTLPTPRSLSELKRRLGGKRHRKGTKIEIIELRRTG